MTAWFLRKITTYQIFLVNLALVSFHPKRSSGYIHQNFMIDFVKIVFSTWCSLTQTRQKLFCMKTIFKDHAEVLAQGFSFFSFVSLFWASKVLLSKHVFGKEAI